MNINTTYTKIITGEDLMETAQHGSTFYPFQFYYEDLSVFDFNCIEWHWHTELEFIYIESGTVTLWIGEYQFHLTEGNGIFINTKVLHRLYSPSKALIPNFVFMPSFIAPCDSLIYQKYILPIISYPLPFLIFHINPNGIPETEKPLIGTALHFRLPSAGFWSLPCRNSCSRHTAWRYEYPLHQKCRFPYLYLRF